MTGRRLTAPAGAPSVDELAGLIDQALELLSAYDTDEASLSETEPLPSLLAQCQMLVDRPDSEPPILRAVVSFGPLDTAAERLLLAQANLELLRGPGTPGSGARETRDAALPPAIRRADLLRAQQTALHGLARDLNASGRRLVVVLDALAGEADLLESGPGDGHDPEEHAQDQAVPRLILSCHPLRSYLLARQRGLLPLGMAGLEDYAAACLQILEQFPQLPHLQLETLSVEAGNGTVEAALAELCTALRLPPVRDALALDLPALDPVPAGALLYPDGDPATEERLDSPAYQDLCRRLGYAPERMPAVATVEQARRITATLPALPARPTERSPSRLSAVLPHLAVALDADAALAPFRLDLYELIARVEDCLDHPDGTLEAIDACVDALSPRDGALVLITCAAHFEAVGDTHLARSLLTEAETVIAPDDRPLRLLTAEMLLKMGKAEIALETLVADALDGSDALSPASGSALRTALGRLSPKQTSEHGHALLLAHLDAHPPAQNDRRRVLIEIGTTRETVPGQGSTEKLARRCAELEIDFITVDMDPRNSQKAQRMFRRLGLPFRAVTAKGEDFLANWQGWIDYCFLDAYDFDHGYHSDLRQNRYESFLGSRIADEACHRMHYDCATSLIAKLAPGGVICFDDTWTDAHGAWTAKGATAMPLLLENGFRVLEARNRAALLARD